MNRISILLLVILATCFIECSKPTAPNTGVPTPVSFTQYDRYSYRGRHSSSDTTFFYLTTTSADFDSLFYFIFDHNIPDTIPTADFATKHVFSVVKYGNDFYQLKVTSLTILDGTLQLEYSCTLVGENLSWTPAIPMIVTATADFKRVRFIENGSTVAEILH